MADLFGLDIAQIVADGIDSAGGVLSCTLNKITPGTRVGGSLTDGTAPTSTPYDFQGFAEKRERRFNDRGSVFRGVGFGEQVSTETISVVTILGATCEVEPEVNDTTLVDGVTYTLLELTNRDPASAVYEFIAEV